MHPVRVLQVSAALLTDFNKLVSSADMERLRGPELPRIVQKRENLKESHLLY